jgi:hypothetical protein
MHKCLPCAVIQSQMRACQPDTGEGGVSFASGISIIGAFRGHMARSCKWLISLSVYHWTFQRWCFWEYICGVDAGAALTVDTHQTAPLGHLLNPNAPFSLFAPSLVFLVRQEVWQHWVLWSLGTVIPESDATNATRWSKDLWASTYLT